MAAFENGLWLLEGELPGLVGGGALEGELVGGSDGLSVGGEAVGDVDGGGGAEGRAVESDAGLLRVPALQDDGGGVGAEHVGGGLRAGHGRIGWCEHGFEVVVASTGQGHEDVVG